MMLAGFGSVKYKQKPCFFAIDWIFTPRSCKSAYQCV